MPPAPSTSRTTTPSTSASSFGSPFFHPSTPVVVASTPGGTRRRLVKQPVEENKSSVVGATANLINAIVGSGIVGIPFAIKEAGLVAGIGLVLICALLTEKSLRMLIETAKHANTPSYETLCEAPFGRVGFFFVSINMFIMSFGGMVSYLMIVKDTLPYVIGLNDIGLRRAFLFLLSLTVMVPLSSQRDMADLAKTSRLSVALDILMVFLVIYSAPIHSTLTDSDGIWNLIRSSTIKPDTLFVGLGVLSFAFVCQHSAFIIAGSLHHPTQSRWSRVTHRALLVCATLATLCGVFGYLGYAQATQGNILNNLDENSPLGNLARACLGITMIFVYPMESFVARHVCVVLLFTGRRAHDGDDATVLQRRDRRITLTVTLYAMALLPAVLFTDLGNVLSVTGTVGGSCLSYIGPGAVFLGVHGREFLNMVESYWNIKDNMTTTDDGIPASPMERTPLTMIPPMTSPSQIAPPPPPPPPPPPDSWFVRCYKSLLWYLLLMPLWSRLARWGADGLDSYQAEMSLKSPHVSRIVPTTIRRRLLHNREDDDDGEMGTPKRHVMLAPPVSAAVTLSPYASSYNQYKGGPRIVQLQLPPAKIQPPIKNEKEGNDDDDDEDSLVTPSVGDFVIAIGYMMFGVLALCAGLVSIYVAG